MTRWIAFLSIVFAGAPLLFADDEPAKDPKDKPEKAKAAEEEKEKDKGKELSPLEKLTKELFKEVDEQPENGGEKEKDNKLQRAAKGMRTAGDKLDDKRTGDETRKVQEQVIRDLDELINQMQNPPPPQGSGGGGGGGSMSKAQKMKGQQSQSQGQSGRNQQANAKSGQGSTKKSGSQEKEHASGSEERTESDRKAAEDAARKKKLEIDVWGHLPPHLRDQLLNTYGERMLPKYENLVKQFYEALSEQGESRR